MNTDPSNFLDQAEKILSMKNSGPSGVLAYAWANAVKTVEHAIDGKEFSYSIPYVNEGSDEKMDMYFAVLRTNRTGIEVAVPPGGTQDIIFELEGKEQYAELIKPKKQIQFLKDELGINISEIDDTKFVAALLSSPRVNNLRLEPAFSAAVRETEEEHGWSHEQNRKKVLSIFETDAELFSKRSFETTPPTPVSQKMFVVETSDFDGTVPVRNDKTEGKIKALLGNAFFEQGDFMSLNDLKAQLEKACRQLNHNQNLPDIAELDYKATISRVGMIADIKERIFRQTLKTSIC